MVLLLSLFTLNTVQAQLALPYLGTNEEKQARANSLFLQSYDAYEQGNIAEALSLAEQAIPILQSITPRPVAALSDALENALVMHMLAGQTLDLESMFTQFSEVTHLLADKNLKNKKLVRYWELKAHFHRSKNETPQQVEAQLNYFKQSRINAGGDISDDLYEQYLTLAQDLMTKNFSGLAGEVLTQAISLARADRDSFYWDRRLTTYLLDRFQHISTSQWLENAQQPEMAALALFMLGETTGLDASVRGITRARKSGMSFHDILAFLNLRQRQLADTGNSDVELVGYIDVLHQFSGFTTPENHKAIHSLANDLLLPQSNTADNISNLQTALLVDLLNRIDKQLLPPASQVFLALRDPMYSDDFDYQAEVYFNIKANQNSESLLQTMRTAFKHFLQSTTGAEILESLRQIKGEAFPQRYAMAPLAYEQLTEAQQVYLATELQRAKSAVTRQSIALHIEPKAGTRTFGNLIEFTDDDMSIIHYWQTPVEGRNVTDRITYRLPISEISALMIYPVGQQSLIQKSEPGYCELRALRVVCQPSSSICEGLEYESVKGPHFLACEADVGSLEKLATAIKKVSQLSGRHIPLTMSKLP